jgi:hypothetical protein
MATAEILDFVPAPTAAGTHQHPPNALWSLPQGFANGVEAVDQHALLTGQNLLLFGSS